MVFVWLEALVYLPDGWAILSQAFLLVSHSQTMEHPGHADLISLKALNTVFMRVTQVYISDLTSLLSVRLHTPNPFCYLHLEKSPKTSFAPDGAPDRTSKAALPLVFLSSVNGGPLFPAVWDKIFGFILFSFFHILSTRECCWLYLKNIQIELLLTISSANAWV